MATFRRAGQAQSKDFNIKSLQYPLDLGTKGLNHMVVFYINIPGNSKVLKNEKETYSVQKTGRSTQEVQSATTSASNNSETVKAGIAKANEYGISIAPEYKQLTAAIALYMPNSFNESYSARYVDVDSGPMFNLFLNSATNSQSVWEGFKSGGISAVKKMLQEVVTNASKTVMGSAGAKLSGKIENPNAEQLFEGMNFRDFSFEFLMSPKSKDEADNILNIINMFKYHMHPEKSENQFLIFPAEFEIEFYSGNPEGTGNDVNQFVGSISTCALTDMSVNYTPNGLWSAFKGTQGYPTSVSLSLKFKEMELLTKDRLEDWGEAPKSGA